MADATTNLPINWTIQINDGTTLVAQNRSTGAIFEGTPEAFNQMILNLGSSETLPEGFAQNIVNKFRESFETYSPNVDGVWLETKAPGDIITVDGNAIGASYLVISKDPLSLNTLSELNSEARFAMPLEFAFGLSMSQRTHGQEFAVEVVEDGNVGATRSTLVISQIVHGVNTLTVTTSTPHGLVAGKRVAVSGMADSRLNYSSLTVSSVPSPTTFISTAKATGNVQNISGTFSGPGVLTIKPAITNATDGVSLLFENTVATNASFFIKGSNGDSLPSGTATGSHSLTIGSTAPVQGVNAVGTYAFQPTTEYRLSLQADRLQLMDMAVDTTAALVNRANRTQVIPANDKKYKVRIKALNEVSMTAPVGKIVSIAKSGTTTATVTFDAPHGLTVNDYINVFGVRDQVNFANLTTATIVTSVVSSTVITVVLGAAVTATSYGGTVYKIAGDQVASSMGAIAQSAQTAQVSTLGDGVKVLTLVGSGNWTGVLIGDYVNLYGSTLSTGAASGYDGVYKVRNISTTSIDLVAVTGNLSLADIGATNIGGCLIRRTDLRISFIRMFDYGRLRVETLARPASEALSAMPVVVNNTPAVTVSSGTVTNSQTGMPVRIADVASTAITSTTTTAAITPTFGCSYSVNIPVTAVTGTNPTMDVRIEESDDDGTNWYTVFEFPRITATGMYRSPKLPLYGNRIRYVQTLTGTTPSFTRSVNRIQYSDFCDPIRQIIDRSIVLNTLNSATPSLDVQNCRNIQVVTDLGTVGTLPVVALQGSDNGTSWYDIATLTLVASTVNRQSFANTQARFTRVIVKTAGATAVLNSLTLKGF
jgi:hypothetical protein